MKRSRPFGPRSRPPRTPRRAASDPDEEAEDELFLRNVETLREVPDKDAATPDPSAPRRIERRPAAKRSRIEPDARLDLHGMKTEEARHALAQFVYQGHRRGDRLLLVITGKGLGSEGGRPVLKQEVERWIRRQGAAQLESWSEAPRRLGGRGAYLLRLRR